MEYSSILSFCTGYFDFFVVAEGFYRHNDQLKRRSLQDENERALALQFSISYEKI